MENLWNKDTSIYRTVTQLWSQWCPYYRGFTVQDSLLWSQWCPCYRGFTVQDSCGPNGVLIIEVSLYRTVYCGPNGVLIIEVSLYIYVLYVRMHSNCSLRITNSFWTCLLYRTMQGMWKVYEPNTPQRYPVTHCCVHTQLTRNWVLCGDI